MIGWPSRTASAPATALASIAGNYDVVYAYHAVDADDPWALYDPSAPDYARDLQQIGPSLGLWVHMTAADDLVVTY